MIYSIELTFDAEQDIERYKKSGDKKILIKIDKLKQLSPTLSDNKEII